MNKLLFFLFPLCVWGLELVSDKAILINAETGKVLFEKNSTVVDYPASLVKLISALYVVHEQKVPLNQVITATKESLSWIDPETKKKSKYRSPAHWLETDSTHMGIQQGEEFTVEMLLHGMLLISANDAANVLAYGVEGSIPRFVEQLNQYLTRLGCVSTVLYNPHGLHHPEMVTTAHDLALIAREVIKEPVLVQICSKTHYTCPETNLSHERYFKQTNKLLIKGETYYPQAFGFKTGTTKAAGKTLIAAAKDPHRTVVGVLLGLRDQQVDRFKEMVALLDVAIQEPYLVKTVFTQKECFQSPYVKAALDRDVAYFYFASEEEPVNIKIQWKPRPFKIMPGDPVGTIHLFMHQEEIAQGTLLSLEQYDRIPRFLIVGGGIFCTLVVVGRLVIRKRKKRVRSTSYLQW